MSNVVIPNELKINIKTNIPGYQIIRYKPSMTLPNDKVDDSIHFNPLVKLKPSIIKSLPKDIQIKEFFNKGLFQSLINTHGFVKAKTLREATSEGYVDNNIQVILDTIFQTNNVLYINKQPYAIVDVQWTKGDWKIDKKIQQMPDLESSKITDPYLYTSIVKDEIISGEQELGALPENILYGPNYTGPTNVAKGVQQNPPSSPPPLPPKPPPMPGKNGKPLPPYPYPQPYPYQYPPIMPPPPPYPYPYPQPYPQPYPYQYPYPAIMPPPSTPPPNKPPKISQIDYGPLTPMQPPVLTYSKASSTDLKNYFQQRNYYTMINTIFQNMNDNEKKLVVKILRETTPIDAKYDVNNISKKAYDASITPGLKVVSNKAGGDCFFLAVADAINYYNANCSNMAERIIYNNYGNKLSFTQLSLREIVAYRLSNLPQTEYQRLYEYAQNNVMFLNNEFKQVYDDYIANTGQPMTSEIFFDNINNIYLSGDNFLVSKPKTMSPETLKTPFTIMNKSNYIEYIKSPEYWADFFTIDTLCDILGLNIITIQNRGGIMSVPYISNSNNRWTRYMFLYFKNNHYELVTFDYTFRVKVSEPKFYEKKTSVKEVIFNKGGNIFPPFYIIFLVFASYYINVIDEKNKGAFQIFPNNLLALLDNIFKNILKNPNNSTKTFINLVREFFHPTILRENNNAGTIDIDGGSNERTGTGMGGAPTYSNQPRYARPYPYQNQPMFYQRPVQMQMPYVSSYLKNQNPLESNKTSISYYITINMELHRGTSLSKEELSNVKCKQRWNAVRKSYADMRGLEYTTLPDYSNLPESKSQNKNQNQNQNQNQNNYTRKNISTPVGQKDGIRSINNRTRRVYI